MSLGKVLIVDGDETAAYIAQRVLRRRSRAGEITITACGREALELVAGEDFDLALLEVAVPVPGGPTLLQALDRLRESTGRPTPRLVVLSNLMHSTLLSRPHPGVEAYLPKPLTDEHADFLLSLQGQGWVSSRDAEQQPLL